MRPAGVVFDLDGTLVDSRLDLAAAVNATRERLGLPPIPVEEVTGMVGEGARMLLRRALPTSLDGGAFDAALALFLDLYYERCLDETTVYPGVAAALYALAPRLPLAVLTNKPERHSRRILDGLGLAAFFSVVIGGDTLAARKPDPSGLLTIARRWGTRPERLLLVGDSDIDAATAAAAGSSLALVGWGFGALEKLAGSAAWRIETPAELVAGLQ